MRRIISTLAACAAAILLSATSVAAQEYKVIVNSANSTTELPADAVSKLFLKTTAKFPNGTAAVPVDLPKTSGVRAAFSKAVIGRPVTAVESFWQQQIFSGKEVPPAVKSNDDEVVAFVKSTPGGIGYVSGGASLSGVKAIDVK